MANIHLVPPISEFIPSVIAIATEANLGLYGGYEAGRLSQKAVILDGIRNNGWLMDFQN